MGSIHLQQRENSARENPDQAETTAQEHSRRDYPGADRARSIALLVDVAAYVGRMNGRPYQQEKAKNNHAKSEPAHANHVPPGQDPFRELFGLNEEETEPVNCDPKADQRYRGAQVRQVGPFIGQMLGEVGLGRSIRGSNLHDALRILGWLGGFHAPSLYRLIGPLPPEVRLKRPYFVRSRPQFLVERRAAGPIPISFLKTPACVPRSSASAPD